MNNTAVIHVNAAPIEAVLRIADNWTGADVPMCINYILRAWKNTVSKIRPTYNFVE